MKAACGRAQPANKAAVAQTYCVLTGKWGAPAGRPSAPETLALPRGIDWLFGAAGRPPPTPRDFPRHTLRGRIPRGLRQAERARRLPRAAWGRGDLADGPPARALRAVGGQRPPAGCR